MNARTSTLAALAVALLTACGNAEDPTGALPPAGPRETIAALSDAIRAGDFEAFADLHTETCYPEEIDSWRQMKEQALADPERLRALAERLGVSETRVRDMTWRHGLAAMLRTQVEADPRWTAHLEHLRVLGEATQGDSSVVRVRYGEPKADEEHELRLVRQDGRWLVCGWD